MDPNEYEPVDLAASSKDPRDYAVQLNYLARVMLTTLSEEDRVVVRAGLKARGLQVLDVRRDMPE